MAWRVAGGIAALAACCVALSQGVRYEVVPLENIYGSLDAYDITEQGVITGSYQGRPPGIAFTLDDHKLSLLPRLPGSTSGNWGIQINNDNAIVGRAIVGLDYHSVLWLKGKPIDLGMTYNESGGDSATGLNESLQISAVYNHQPAIWEAGQVSFLPVPVGTSSGGATGINANGDVAGRIRRPDLRASKWVNGIYHDLHPQGYDDSNALGIADNGDVGGEVKRPGLHNAALWKANGDFIDLGSLGPGMPSYFNDLNSKGQVVGMSAIDGQFRAFLWENGTMRSLSDLAPPGWTVINAWAVNDVGQIVATGTFGRQSGAILLNPVPELNTFSGLVFLWIGFQLIARQRKATP